MGIVKMLDKYKRYALVSAIAAAVLPLALSLVSLVTLHTISKDANARLDRVEKQIAYVATVAEERPSRSDFQLLEGRVDTVKKQVAALVPMPRAPVALPEPAQSASEALKNTLRTPPPTPRYRTPPRAKKKPVAAPAPSATSELFTKDWMDAPVPPLVNRNEGANL